MREQIIKRADEILKEGYEDLDEYFVPWGSWFNTPPYYEEDKILQIVETSGGQNVHLEHEYGVDNQPMVVVFDADPSTAEDIGKALEIGLDNIWVLVDLKNQYEWGML